ncbi:MAG TPA: lipid-binding SYLF domain-containing protein [Myxococcota bacterium]|jgi:lipid-binding SYLF domain-containing protein
MPAPIRVIGLILLIALASTSSAAADTAAEINRDSTAALNDLYAKNPAAKTLAGKAKAILIFPSIVKGGFIVGGQTGTGALRKGGKTVGFYRSVAGSYGLQAGVQKFGYAMMFMDNASLAYLDKSDGWEVGVGPSLVIVDEGKAKSLTTTTAREGVYAFIFDQKGLMGGMGIQGSKITRFTPKK